MGEFGTGFWFVNGAILGGLGWVVWVWLVGFVLVNGFACCGLVFCLFLFARLFVWVGGFRVVMACVRGDLRMVMDLVVILVS